MSWSFNVATAFTTTTTSTTTTPTTAGSRLTTSTSTVSSFSRRRPLRLPLHQRKTNTQLFLVDSSSSSATETTTSSTTSDEPVDYDALLKYHGAIAIQMALFAALFTLLDTAVTTAVSNESILGLSPDFIIPLWMLLPFFYAISLKSRVLNPLDNARPNLKQQLQTKPRMNEQVAKSSDTTTTATTTSKGFGDRIMPSWTPRGFVFPIMWLLIIGPMRAYSSALIYQTHHSFMDPALLAFVFHLSVGDVWNTIYNSEQRYGASVTAVLCVTASALYAAYQYALVNDTAGHVLGLPVIWFAVITSLVTAIWKLNPKSSTTTTSSGRMENTSGKSTTTNKKQITTMMVLDPLYPTVRSDGQSTKFAWFQ